MLEEVTKGKLSSRACSWQVLSIAVQGRLMLEEVNKLAQHCKHKQVPLT